MTDMSLMTENTKKNPSVRRGRELTQCTGRGISTPSAGVDDAINDLILNVVSEPTIDSEEIRELSHGANECNEH